MRKTFSSWMGFYRRPCIRVISLYDMLEEIRETLVLYNSIRTEVLKTHLPSISVSGNHEENGWESLIQNVLKWENKGLLQAYKNLIVHDTKCNVSWHTSTLS